MSSAPYVVSRNSNMPVYNRWEYAMGCEDFILKAKDKKNCDRMIDKLLVNIPNDRYLFVYDMGLHPDQPVPVARYFVECHVSDNKDTFFANSVLYQGRFVK